MKLRLLVVLFFLLITAFLFGAVVCPSCSTQFPPEARFCPGCGAIRTQMIPIQARQPAVSVSELKEQVLALFSPVDRFEKVMTSMVYTNIIGMFPEFKIRFKNAWARYSALKPDLPEELRIVGQVYATKYRIFNGVVRFMKNLRMNMGLRDALIRYGNYSCQEYGKLLQMVREKDSFSPHDLDQLEQELEAVKSRTKKHKVTSKFLKLGDTKIPRNGEIIVLEIVKRRANVIYLGATAKQTFEDGWIALDFLAKRTTWTKKDELYFQQPIAK